MPTCAVEGCTNSSKKKFKMNSLPRNPVQRALWMKNIGRLNWIPKENEAVCEVHFPPEMWEKTRVDGTRKLKYNAVPTIFYNRAKESPNLHILIPPEKNQSDINVPNNKQQTFIQILPLNWLNSQQSSLIIPTSSTVSSINSKLLFNNPKNISIRKPKIKIKSMQVLNPSKSNTSVCEKVKNAYQKKVIISNNSDSSEMKPHLSHSLPIDDINNVNDVTEVETDCSQSAVYSTTVDQASNLSSSIPTTNVRIVNGSKSMLIPMMVDTNNSNYLKPRIINLTENLPLNKDISGVTESEINGRQSASIPMVIDSTNSKTQVINLQKSQIFKSISNATNISNLNTEPSIVSENFESSNQQKSEGSIPSGIILNKAEAKKKEDERFEKMDKLLLKQLKLNDALRKKLVVLRARLQRLMKNQQKQHEFGSTLFLKKVFTDDQIKVLQMKHLNPKSITAWSDNTMMKAIKLKRACGLHGYEEILKQNLPYPSFRTITRWCLARNIEIP